MENLLYDPLPDANFFILGPSYPNPFNSYTNFRVQIFAEKEIKLEIWNTLGQCIKTIFNGTKEKGEHYFRWSGKNQNNVVLPSGMYFARMQSGAQVQWRKMIYLK